MATYKYGAYGNIGDSVARSATQAGTVAVYFGTAPVNLVKGYAAAGIVNNPVKVIDYTDAQRKVGYSENWGKFTLCEAIEAHFNNSKGNIGPVYLVNVLDPDKHRKDQSYSVTETLAFDAETHKATFEAKKIKIETLQLVVAGEASAYEKDTDYTVTQDGDTVTIEDITETHALAGVAGLTAAFDCSGKRVSLTFTNGRCEFLSDDIILDTFTLEAPADFEIDYNFTKGSVIVSGDNLTGTINASFEEVDASAVVADDIIGGVTAGGEYSGLGVLKLLYTKENAVANLIAAPGWSKIKDVYAAMITAAQKINGHWEAFVFADIPTEDVEGGAGTIEAAKAWQKANSYTNERSKVYWPQARDAAGHVYHTATLAMVEQMRADENNGGVPMETSGNKEIPVIGQYFGANSKNGGFDQQSANELTQNGISTLVYWGGAWVLWGDHTAAYAFGKDTLDPRAIFDVSMRMLFHCVNGFQRRNGVKIDKPFTKRLKDQILDSEQEILDGYVEQGALIGDAKILFLESSNSVTDMMNGDFVFDLPVTPTPPMKSATINLCYTDAGFEAYFAE